MAVYTTNLYTSISLADLKKSLSVAVFLVQHHMKSDNERYLSGAKEPFLVLKYQSSTISSIRF